MATPTFASGSSFTALEFANSGMSGNLAANGNTVQVEVGGIAVKSLEFAPPGGDWTARRVLGRATRRVVWRCQLKATSDAALNTVESAIEALVVDGGAYALTDGRGRSTDYATLLDEGTRRVGPRIPTVGGARVQRWELTFSVLWPQTGSTQL